MDMQRLQESGYGDRRDYREGSPHLTHWRLYDHLTELLRRTIAEVVAADLPPTVLEIGAGHGGYTEPALAAGAQVVATEMSRPSIARLTDRYGANPGFQAVFDPDGSLEMLGAEQFSIIVCSSVLHHIPDYLGFLAGPMMVHLSPGGSFYSLQDPLWYPSVGRLTRTMDRWSYLFWRVTRGNYAQGLATFGRRMRGVYDSDNPADMVEYHVVRQGVDHAAIGRLLEGHFTRVELGAYWSTASQVLQRAGERLHHPNTFFARASGFAGPPLRPVLPA